MNKLCNNEHALAHQQFIEMHDLHTGKQNLRDINPSLRELSGLDVHIPTSDNGIGSANAKSSGSGHRTESAGDVDAWRKLQLTIQNLDQQEVNHRTGLCDLCLLLSFVSVVCGGDLTSMTRTSSILTWFEEWILCCEFVWGRTLLRY